jgi:uncharacterized protein YyaL (SSP411 family)
LSIEKYTNRLIHESSPYLLQHAHNPVDWYPWCDEAFEKAKKENKLVLISIGYSACHWCHVMERESFENEEIAAVMNKFFVSIKVDREERPDVDQIYMNAVQLMSGQGGWPLNCFVLPDGKPVYGGTYFRPEQWFDILHHLRELYATNRAKMEEYAHKLTEGIKSEEEYLKEAVTESVGINSDALSGDPHSVFDEMISRWENRFDTIEGGPNRAPKFMLPNNYIFLMRYAFLGKEEKIQEHVKLTLDKMAMGGIFDQVGGGFSRYSTDMIWKVPHFEKMVYDNAQLIHLYSEAYRLFKDELYKETVYKTIDFLQRELTGKDGEFYSALDADSEGEEGKFYVWKKEELKLILKEEYELAASYYDLNGISHWEHGNHILLRRTDDEEFAVKNDITVSELKKRIQTINSLLLEERNQRIRPGLDDKTLTSWNAMMVKGLSEAYQSFGENRFLEIAERNIHFILSNQLNSDGTIFHSCKNGKSTVNGFLEDYAFLIDALISLYQSTGKENYLNFAQKFTQVCFDKFFDAESGFFYFTSSDHHGLIARKIEIQDNVIPSSNSVMANNLWVLSRITDKPDYEKVAKQMTGKIIPQMGNYGSAFSNWGIQLLYQVHPFYEVAITGNEASIKAKAIQKEYIPNKVVAFSETESTLPLLTSRLKKDQTLIYICRNKSCNLPLDSSEDAIKQLKV